MSKFNPNQFLLPILLSGAVLTNPNFAEAKGNSAEKITSQNKTEIVLAETTLKEDIGSARRTIDKKIYPTVNKVYMGGKKKVREGAEYVKRKYEEHQNRKSDRGYNRRINRLRRENNSY